MKTAHLYIYGEIDIFQDKSGADYGMINLTNVKSQLDAQPGFDEVTVHIHCVGGYVTEGFAIHDYLRSLGKPITTIIEGMCYSIATVIALAGDKRIMTANSDFMIHNPSTVLKGEAAELRKEAAILEKLEIKAAEFYSSKSNLTVQSALDYMKNETFFTPEEALSLGLITEIAPAMKAVAKYNLKPEKVKKQKKGLNALQKLMKRVEAALDGPVSKMVLAADGETELDFPDLESDDTPSVGDRVLIDGSASDKEVPMPGGETYVLKGGKLESIVPADESTSEDPEQKAEVEELQMKVKNLKKQLKESGQREEALEREVSKNRKQMKKIAEDLAGVKKMIKSEASTEETNRSKKKKMEGDGNRSRSLWKKEKEE